MPNMGQKMTEAMKSLNPEALATSKYYKGGFDPKMNRREAALILGISPSASKLKVTNLYFISKFHSFTKYDCLY